MRLLIFCFAILIFTSCKEEEKELSPYPELSNEKFIKVYIELKTMEVHLQKKTPHHQMFKKWMKEASDSIFKKYNTDGPTFYGAYDYYMQDPLQLYSIFESALDTINLRKNQLTQ